MIFLRVEIQIEAKKTLTNIDTKILIQRTGDILEYCNHSKISIKLPFSCVSYVFFDVEFFRVGLEDQFLKVRCCATILSVLRDSEYSQ